MSLALTAGNALLGNVQESARGLARLLELNPSLRVSNLDDTFIYRRKEDRELLAKALSLAGLPE